MGGIVTVILLIFSCDKLQPDHPQAGIKVVASQPLNEADINSYADSINSTLDQFEKQESLVFSRGDRSFSVVKYVKNGEPVLYIEKGDSGEYEASEKRYYLHEGRLVLYTEKNKSFTSPTPVSYLCSYFRNNILFYTKRKTATDEIQLKSSSFAETEPSRKDQYLDIVGLENALKQNHDFNLVFEGIAEYPKAKYLILSRNGLNTYRAALRVDSEDDLIHELATNPDRYAGSKLDLTWKINKDNEAIYQSGRVQR